MNEGFDLKTMIAHLYDLDSARMDFPDALDDGKQYDFALLLPKEETQEKINQLIKDRIERQLHVEMVFETRQVDVYVLTAPNGQVTALKVPAEDTIGGSSGSFTLEGKLVGDPSKISVTAGALLTGINISDASMEDFSRLQTRARQHSHR